MKKRIILGAVILVIIAGAILGYSLIKKGKTEGPSYRTEKIALGDIEALVTTSGTINPVDLVDVGSQVSGKIVKLYADYNSQVKVGQIVAELDQELLKAKVDQNQSNYESALARLEQAKSTLDNAKRKNDRTLDLFQRNLVSFEEKETAEAAYIGAKVGIQTSQASVSQAKSQFDSSKVDLSYAIIRSPIDGTVITRNVNLGQTVAASFSAPVLFKIASDLSKMQVTCSVDEADIGKVQEGQKVRFTVDAFPGETFNGAIRQVRNSAQTVQNVVTYETIVTAGNPQGKLKPGMTATVSIITGEAKAAVKVPNAALRFTPNLPAEELKKIMEEARGQTQAQRGGEGGPTPQAGEQRSEGQAAGGQAVTGQAQGGQRQGGERQGGQRFDMSQMSPDQIQAMMQRAQGARRQGGQVWILDDQGKIKPFFVRTGVTDNNYSEMTRGELKEGMTVILGLTTPGSTTAQQQQNQQRGGGGPGGMMIFR
jgi:HlyD family secretion protein